MAQASAVKVIDRPEPSALGEMVNAELTNQIATARRYPRDEAAALKLLAALATRSDAVAESCMYTLRRTDKDGTLVFITGPSVRFAELLNYCWGNMRAGARIIDEGEKALVAQGVAYDLQRNTGMMLEVRRGIVTSKGHRFGPDMINVTANAACSIALRNVIFDCIPQVLWWDVYEEVKDKALGAAQIPERIQKAVRFFVSKGAKPEDILTALGARAIEDMGRQHLEILIGLNTALKDGAIDAAKIFTAEGKEQRDRLTLLAPDDDGEPMTPVDKLLNKGKPQDEAAPPAEKGGRRKAAAKSPDGDGGVSATKADSEHPTPASEPAGSGDSEVVDDASTGEPAAPADSYREDEQLVAGIEGRLDPAKAMSSRKAVDANRGALLRIAETSPKNLAARAAKILQDWPAK